MLCFAKVFVFYKIFIETRGFFKSIYSNYLWLLFWSDICLHRERKWVFKGSGTESSAWLPSGVFKQLISASKNGMAVAIRPAELRGWGVTCDS